MNRPHRRPPPARTLALLCGVLWLAGCGQPTAPQVGRLLPGSPGGGGDWTLEGEWFEEELPPHPEEGLAPHFADGFEVDPVGQAPLRWICPTDPDVLLPRGLSASEAEVPRVESQAQGRALCFGERPGAACLVLPASPLTPYVIRFKMRASGTAPETRHLVLVESGLESPAAPDEGFLRRARAEHFRLTAQPASLTAEFARRGEPSRSVRGIEVWPLEDGFEQWRIEYHTTFGTRSLLLGLFGTPPDRTVSGAQVLVDDFEVFEIPVRAALGSERWEDAVSLTGGRAALEAQARIAKVRRDGETRRSLLLSPGSSASCRFATRSGAARLELGLCVVPEDRLSRHGTCIQKVRVQVARAGHRAFYDRRHSLHLRADTPYFWRDLLIPLAAAGGEGHRTFELRVEVPGETASDSLLVALSEPRVLRPGVGLAADSAIRQGEPLNLVLVSVDTLRADRIGRAPYGFSLTPHLDSLSREAAVFEDAVANAAYTLPSHVTMFTGQDPEAHGVLSTTHGFSEQRSPLLAQVLAEAGYVTAAFTGGGMLNPDFCAIDGGFDRFAEIDPLLSEEDGLPGIAPRKDQRRYNRELFDRYRMRRRVLPWIEAHQDVPFFLFLHTYQVHNYEPGDDLHERFEELRRRREGSRYRESRLRRGLNVARSELPQEIDPAVDLPFLQNLYDATVYRVDRDLGELVATLKRLGLYERTVIAVTSDHGEEFLEHGGLSHSRTLYEETLRIPWILRVPGLPARTVRHQVQLADLAPTLLGAVQVPAPAAMGGTDQLSPAAAPGVALLAGVLHPGENRRGARGLGCKLLEARPARRTAEQRWDHLLEALGYVRPEGTSDVDEDWRREEFFDLRSDPAEQWELLEGGRGDSLAAPARQTLSTLRSALQRAARDSR